MTDEVVLPKFPKSLGACIDKLYGLRAKRLAAQKKIEAMGAMETAYENHILNTFAKADLDGAKGKTATAGIKRQTIYSIKDWEAFTGYVAETKQWDLMRKQAGSTACRERYDNGVEIPGIEPIAKITLSLTKAGS
jgi:hypothetical protein